MTYLVWFRVIEVPAIPPPCVQARCVSPHTAVCSEESYTADSQRLPGQETGNDGCCARLGSWLGKTSCWEGNVVCVECLKAGK